MTNYQVVITPDAAHDLLRLQDFALQRELASATPDFDVIERMLEAVDKALGILAFSPYTCRRADRAVDPRQRELIIPFGHSGFIAAVEIHGQTVYVGGVRHQLEQDLLR